VRLNEYTQGGVVNVLTTFENRHIERFHLDNDPWNEEIRLVEREGLLRTMPMIKGLPGRTISVNGRRVLNFSSNNYLGLAGHPQVVSRAIDALREYGAGATASRLIAGNLEIHRELELLIAEWKQTADALIFGSGYQANVGLLSALVDERDLIVSDELNHASIIDGCRLSRGRVFVYGHGDANHAGDILRKNTARRKIVVTESIFSMDGDVAPLSDLRAACDCTGSILMVDEAHATGIVGPGGAGLSAELGILPDIQMGTLGKAVGVVGAYVAGEKSLIKLLINKSRSLIYTTAQPPAMAGAALAALQIIVSPEGESRRIRLSEKVRLFYEMLKQRIGARLVMSHIVPVVIGPSKETMAVSHECLDQGVFAHGVRYPTVPEGTARLRFTLMSDHTEEDLKRAVEALTVALQKVSPRLVLHG